MRDWSSSGRKKTLEAVTSAAELIMLSEKSKPTLSPNDLFIVLTNHLKTGVCLYMCVRVCVCVMGGFSEITRQDSVHCSCIFACIFGCDTRSQAPQKIRVSTFMSLFLPSSKQLLERGGLIWLLLLLLTANVLLFVHLWHLSPQKPCCKKPC